MSTPSALNAPPASTNSVPSAVVHVHTNRAELPIVCRPGRRLGQHAVALTGADTHAFVGLDAYLATQKAAGANSRILFAGIDQASLLDALRPASTSPIVIRLADEPGLGGATGATWMLDQDQTAALLGQRWTFGDTHHAHEPWCQRHEACHPWQTPRYTLAPPCDRTSLDGERGGGLRPRLQGLWTYAEVLNSPSKELPPNAKVVRASTGGGSGRPGIEISREQRNTLRDNGTIKRLRFNDWVVLRHDLSSAVGPDHLRIPVTVRKHEPPKPKSRAQGVVVEGAQPLRPSKQFTNDDIGVDQVIRLALGVAEWEAVTLEPITQESRKVWARRALRLKRRRRTDWLTQKMVPSVHVVARAQPAELTLTEQNACLLSPLALDSLGLKSGDEVVLHAAADPSEHHPGTVHVKKRLKAYAATEDVIARRMTIHGGGRAAPVPNEEQALHFSQALPWIWVDAAARHELGLPSSLGAVVVAPRRWYVLTDNLREVAIVAAVALGGVAASTQGSWRYVWAGAALVLPIALIGARIRSKLR